ncbi:MAG: VirB4 family type IV secretion system protein, partial [Solirubrobacteraceae bacterium]
VQTVLEAGGAEQPAVAARWWVAVSHEPAATTVREQYDLMRARARGRTPWRAHLEAARHSWALAAQVQSVLDAIGIETHRLDGVQAIAVLWERMHPAASTRPDFSEFEAATEVVETATPAAARELRHRVAQAICGQAPAGIDASDPVRLQHADGTLEEILHIGTPPLQTSPWWLSYLLACPLPCTLAVHIRVGSRHREIARQRRRWRRLRAAVIYKERRGQLVGAGEHEALDEAQAIDGELSGEIGATVYQVGIYLAIRDATGEAERFEQIVSETARVFHSMTNARVIRGRWLNLRAFPATLPLGVDELRATRSYGQRNIAHCVPLTSSSCGSPSGLVLGTADPGGTLERVDPFDPLFPRRVTLVLGPSGGGKTVLMNVLLMRAIAQGMRGWIIDRSSTPDEHGDTAGSGHYDTLLSLIPGARRVQVGSASADVICPWDVQDPARVPSEKKEFLLALHALLVGHARGSDRRERSLTAVEEGLLSTAIDAVYARADRERARPRETMLADELRARAQAGGLSGTNADAVESLVLRLEPYCEGASLAHIADRATTVPDDAPLTLFDLTGMPERLTPAMVLMLVSHIEQRVQHERTARVRGQLDGHGAWAGKLFLVVEEGWALTSSPAAGAWLNEYARRSRHYALWLMFVTQHFKDLANEQGRALLANSVLRLCLQNDRDDLELGRDTIGLTDTDIEQITTLPRKQREYSTVYVVSPRGRGAVRVSLAALEYWIASSDPEHDQPRRRRALDAAGGDPWEALRTLCTEDTDAEAAAWQ